MTASTSKSYIDTISHNFSFASFSCLFSFACFTVAKTHYLIQTSPAPIKTHLWFQLDETCPNLFITLLLIILSFSNILNLIQSIYLMPAFSANSLENFQIDFLIAILFSCFNKFHFSNHDLPNPIPLHCNMYQHRRPEDSIFKKPQQNTKPHYQELFREESCT